MFEKSQKNGMTNQRFFFSTSESNSKVDWYLRSLNSLNAYHMLQF